MTLAVAAMSANRRDLNQRYLSAVANLHDVSVLHDVVFSFKSQQSFLLQRLMAAVFHEVVVVADLRANEVILQVCVNHAGRALRIRAAARSSRRGTLLRRQ